MGMLENGQWTPTRTESWRTQWYQQQGQKDLDAGNYGEALRKMVVLGGMPPEQFAQLHNIKNPGQAIVPEDITTYLEHANTQTKLNNNSDAYITKEAYDRYYDPSAAPLQFSNPNSMVAKLWEERYVNPARQKWGKQLQQDQKYQDMLKQYQQGAELNPNNAGKYTKYAGDTLNTYNNFRKSVGFTPATLPTQSPVNNSGMLSPTAAPISKPATVGPPPTVGDSSAWKAKSMFQP